VNKTRAKYFNGLWRKEGKKEKGNVYYTITVNDALLPKTRKLIQ